MIDLKFIKFYVESIHNKSIEEYFHVERSTISNWKHRNMPERYLEIFIELEKSSDIYELFDRIYPKNKENKMNQKQQLAIDVLAEIKTNRSTLENYHIFNSDPLLGIIMFSDILRRLEKSNLYERLDNKDYVLTKHGEDILKDNTLIANYI